MSGDRSDGQAEYRDLVLHAADPDRGQHLYNLFNVLSQAATTGLVTASARSGLGTVLPVGESLSRESLYYQALRVFSCFDWELQRQLCRVAERWPLPASLAVLVGRFPARFLDRFEDQKLPAVHKSQRALTTLMPDLQPFAFRRLGAEDYRFLGQAPGPGRRHEPGAGGVKRSDRRVAFAAAIRDQLWQGTAAKLAGIAADTYAAETVEIRHKLETMVGAFAPLATVFGAELVGGAAEQSYTRLTLYLPAFHTLHAEEIDDPRSWYLERGMPRIALPKPVQIRAAELTHLSYLGEADRDCQQAIAIEVRRDFFATGPVTVTTRFGRLFGADTEELFGLDTSDPRDGFYVGFRPHLPVAEDDSAAVRAVKEGFQRVFGGFEVEARIQELTLDLHRSATADDPDGAAEVLRPRFSLERSRISFRAHRHTASATERVSLRAAGFTCEPADPISRISHCYRDFFTWDRFAEFLAGRDPEGRPGGLWAHGRERLLEQVVGFATKAVLDHSIPSIETAIDDEIARVVGDYLDRYARAREVLTDRLHGGLF